jgi:hypothetical protein
LTCERVRGGGKGNSIASRFGQQTDRENQGLQVSYLSLMSHPQKIFGGPHLGHFGLSTFKFTGAARHYRAASE